MATKFTEEQSKAIETTDRSVLVSAAAGSGKTAVLIERIIRIILDGKAGVDEMLVVTFTNAAAAEMRLRLSRAIRKRMTEHPEDAPRMKEQLSRLYKAYISTIDSFALRVIREFFHETDMEPSFGILDDVRGELLRREAVHELFEEGFQNDGIIEGGSFREFLRLYSEERTEEGFMDKLLKSYDKLRTMPDYFSWAYERAEQLQVTAENFEGSALREMMAEDAAETFGGVMDAMAKVQSLFEDAGLSELFESKLRTQADHIADIYANVRRGVLDADTLAAIASVPKATVTAKKDQKESYETIKDEVKEIRTAFKKEIDGFKNRYLLPDFETRLKELNATYGYTVYYLKLLEEFERRYSEKKREHKLIDFADMEHIAVRILKKEEAADTLRRRFKFVFVDEYQDTNNIQEHLISRVSRPDNVFRVGDVKQSIYKFRQAEPEIFERLYADYSDGKTDGVAIDLGRNFRSNRATINYINHVFGRIMEGYDERAKLYAGLPDKEGYDFLPEVHILTEEDGNTEDAELDDGYDAEAGFADEEIEELTKEEAEAEYIADLVASVIGTEFYDSKAGVVRKAEARDIVILFRAVRYRGEVMSRALRERGAEPHIEESEDYFDTVEMGVALSLLSCIDNMKRDVPLIATLHSEVFGFDPEDLAKIRTAHAAHTDDRRSPYYEAFSWYAEEGPEGDLRDRVRYAKEKLLEWRALSRMLPLEDFIWKLMTDSGYYRMAGAMPGGAARQANIRALADRAARFSKDNIASLGSFLTFLDAMRSHKIKSNSAPLAGKDDNVVRISTIHKSKGLEYPFVIVGGLGHRFKWDTNEKAFSFDSGLGVGMPYIDPGRRYWRSTIIQRAINAKSVRDSYREELRLLYVAMTRARNKLYLVGTAKSEADLAKYRARPGNFLEAMKDVLRTGFNTYRVSPLMLTKQQKNGSMQQGRKPEEPLSREAEAIYAELDIRFTYTYPHEDLLTAKAKYSVSEIRRNELEQAAGVNASKPDTEVVNLWRSGEEKKRASAADIGIAYHRIMEFMDFGRATDAAGRPDESYIKDRADFLHDHGAIDDDVYRSLDLTRIAAFFADDLGRRAVEADRRGALRKEKAFTLRTERNGRSMLVQGVIDCCFEEDGKMILIDYKSSFLRPGKAREAEKARIREEYRVQVELYSEAVKKGTGKDVSEAYLYLFTASEAVDMMQQAGE